MSEDKDHSQQEVIHSRIWDEEPEADNPFVAAKCFCAGYDVYDEILVRSSWAEYLFLLFKLDRPQNGRPNYSSVSLLLLLILVFALIPYVQQCVPVWEAQPQLLH